MSILEDYPREELFQIATDDLFRTVMGVLRLAGRRQVRLFARKDQYGRFISCLVYLPRDRFTTANRLKIQEILLRGAARDRGRLHHPGHRHDARPDPLHRAHRPGHPPGRDRHRRAHRPDRRRHPALARRLRPPAGAALGDEPARAAASSATARRCRRSTRTPTPRTRRPRTWPCWSCSTSRASSCCTCSGARKNDGDVRFKVFRYGEPMTLSDVLPVLHSLGVRVQDERPYEVAAGRRDPAHLRLRAGPAARVRWTSSRSEPRSRTRSRRPGGASPKWTASTSWCCRPA